MKPALLGDAVPHSPTLVDIARFLNLGCVRTVTRLLAAGELPIRERPRMGRGRRFYGADLRALVVGETPGQRHFFGHTRPRSADGLHRPSVAPARDPAKSNPLTETEAAS